MRKVSAALVVSASLLTVVRRRRRSRGAAGDGSDLDSRRRPSRSSRGDRARGRRRDLGPTEIRVEGSRFLRKVAQVAWIASIGGITLAFVGAVSLAFTSGDSKVIGRMVFRWVEP